MNLQPNQRVIICLQGNVIIEGIIESYSNNEIILTSLNSVNKLIVPHPERDIVFVKIIYESLQEEKLSKITEKISDELHKVLDEKNDDLKNKSINHLIALRSEQEQKIISERLKDHQLGAPRSINYTYPGTNIKQVQSYGTTRFYKKPGPK